MKKQIFLILAAVFLVIFSGCSEKKKTVSIKIGNDTYNIEIAVTREEQETGLMFRKKIDPDTGMIFVYKKDLKLSFWMKNTYVPLSIAFISRDGTIKEIHNMKPESLTPVNSAHSVRYALELPLGSYKRSGAKTGDKLILPEIITDN